MAKSKKSKSKPASSEAPVKAPPSESAPKHKKLPSAWTLTRRSTSLLWKHKGLFGGITVIYALLSLILVRGFSSGVQLESVNTLLGSEAGKVVGGLAAYTWLINSSATGTNQMAAVYQTIVLVIVSLAVVWALRQVLADGRNIRVRDAFYQGMYPLIPVALVIITLFLQLVPTLIGLTLLNLVAGSGAVAVRPVEVTVGIIVCVGLIVLGLYLFISSVFSFYIAALPDMTPMRALRSSRQLTRGRRLSVLRKLLWLPLLLLVLGLVIVLPFIWLATPLAPWVVFVFTVIMLPVVHAYLYTLYREMIS